MSRPPVIVDTNVVVSGLLTSDPASPVALILDGMVAAKFTFVLSEALLAEYHAVLARPTISKRHALTAAEVESILTSITRHAIVLTPSRGPAAPDPGDQLLWDLLATRDDLVLVTGDQALLNDKRMRSRVQSPSAFVA